MGKKSSKKQPEPESSSEVESSEENAVESSSEEEVAPQVGSKRKLENPTETAPKKARGGGAVTLFVGNLPWSTSEDEIREFFSDCSIVSMRMMNDRDTGRFKGFCYVDFLDADVAEKALGYAGSDYDGRSIKVDHTQTSSAGDTAKSLTVYVGSLSYDTTEESITQFFSECGTIASVRMISDREGNPKGFGYIEFEDQDGADSAVTYHGSELDGRNLRVTYDSKKPDSGRGGFRGGRGGDRGGRGGRGGGFRGGRGGYGDRDGGFRGGRGGRGGGFRGGRGGYGDRDGGRGGGFRGGRGGDRGGRGGFRGGSRGGTDSFRGKKITFD